MADTRLEPVVLSDDERRTLESWVRRRSTAQGLARRARIVLACADGGSNVAVAARLRVERRTVARWRGRFLEKRLDGLADDPRPGVPGLYLAPPANAVVFSLDEKPQIQALQRTAPVPPMLPGIPERRSFDYERHGTSTARSVMTSMAAMLAQSPQSCDASSPCRTAGWPRYGLNSPGDGGHHGCFHNRRHP
jgi:transposase